MKREELIILIAFLLFVQGYLFGNVFPAILAFSIVLYLAYLRAEFSPKIEAERKMDRKLTEGEKSVCRLKLRNLTNKKLKIVILEDLLPPGFKAETPQPFILNGGEEKEIEYSIVPVRGVYKIRGPKIRVFDLRELYYSDFVVDSEIEVEVYPSIDKIREESEAAGRIKTPPQKSLLGPQTTEVRFLRRFQPGDDTRLIEWKATARFGRFIVKELEREIEGNVYIILDAGKEMRKGIRNAKIDYAVTLTLQLAYALRDFGVGLIVYDDFGVKCRIPASKSPEQIERIARSLKISPTYLDVIGVKLSELKFRISDESRKFLRKVLPMIKGRRSLATGIIEAVKTLPSSAFLIFICDITSNTGELVKVLLELRDRYKIVLLTPNPILFYDESKLDREKLVWLYRRYLEREEIIKKLNRIVPTFDLGPSDLLDVIGGALT